MRTVPYAVYIGRKGKGTIDATDWQKHYFIAVNLSLPIRYAF